ncbi:carbohydrate kinase family protein [Planctomicrobium piriforme]|uniref:Sugar or nucleoside kinase, ribokinase family n=1 Tax=Planctomicrobium piriforme TaxID=1576369 RepID=A0A1I3E4K2_9PLAN|nr:carbohydrate kinase family protein [Planctomicrobium piriforme]SFH93895.1 Sugar or nucleoside kinase, ribokinase family [Planctomicrobium piriforme]
MTERTASEVLCVGLIGADYVTAGIPRWPAPGTLIRTQSLTLTVGGCAGNISIDLARLGVPTSILTCIGRDLHGEFLRGELERQGVCCEHLIVSERTHSSSTLVMNIEGEDRRFVHYDGACAELTGCEITDEMLDGCRVLCVAGMGVNAALTGENVAEAFRRARERGITTLLDLVFEKPDIALQMTLAALPYTDVFLPNTDEARQMTGLSDPDEQAEYFLQAGARTVVITLGAEGVLLHSRETGRIRLPAHRVPVIDGTGSGDAFDAGFIYGLLKGASLLECLRYGSALGASCVQSPGGTTGVFDRDQLEEFVKRCPLIEV